MRSIPSLGSLIVLGAAAMADHTAALIPRIQSPARVGTRYSGRRTSGSIAKLNRHTGKPHEHKREIARRLRQAERKAAK